MNHTHTQTIWEQTTETHLSNKTNENHNTLADTLQTMAKRAQNHTFSIHFIVHTSNCSWQQNYFFRCLKVCFCGS